MRPILNPEVSLRHPLFWLTGFTALVVLATVIGLVVFLVTQSFPIFQHSGWSFVSGTDWFPDESYGIWPFIYGSLMVTGLALVWTLPLSIGCALFTAEYLPGRSRVWVKAAMELLAGVPGIIYGLLGVAFLSVWVRDVLGLIDGNTLLTASLLLAVMVLPTIMTLAEDAFRAVPVEFRESARALGLTQAEIIFGVVFPQALPAVVGAVLLGLGRAMGETVAVMLVIGGLDQIPAQWYNPTFPGQSIPSKLGREAAETLGSGLHWNALVGLGLILFLMVIGISLLGMGFLKRRARA